MKLIKVKTFNVGGGWKTVGDTTAFYGHYLQIFYLFGIPVHSITHHDVSGKRAHEIFGNIEK